MTAEITIPRINRIPNSTYLFLSRRVGILKRVLK
jgi:hypothetical protein